MITYTVEDLELDNYIYLHKCRDGSVMLIGDEKGLQTYIADQANIAAFNMEKKEAEKFQNMVEQQIIGDLCEEEGWKRISRKMKGLKIIV